jgi:formate-dependent phosphoribosylglycinamide formyltransferase (GAR transformylase)
VGNTGRVGVCCETDTPKTFLTGSAEQHGEWAEGRRYLGLDVLALSRTALAPAIATMATG